MALEGPRYDEARQRYRQDPVVQAMARELHGRDLDTMFHERGDRLPVPLFSFMQACNRDYARRTGRHPDGHIGAVAEAIYQVLTDEYTGDGTARSQSDPAALAVPSIRSSGPGESGEDHGEPHVPSAGATP